MDLFDSINDHHLNHLPYDGEVNYHGILLSPEKADSYLARLMQEIDWRQDEAVIYGKRIKTRRKVAWHGDEPFEYTYAKTTKRALPWTKDLLSLRKLVQNKTGEEFNSCLLNLYHDGSEGMSWHSDAERDLKKNGAIASLSLGAERKFAFKHKSTKEVVSLMLQHGSLLVMKGTTQSHWLHRLPTTKKVSKLRINLTFRTIEDQQ